MISLEELKNTDIRLIALDLDGTVLTEDKRISRRTADAISRAIAAGKEIVPVTGRPSTGLPFDLLDIKGINFLITSNGSLTQDLRSGGFIRTALIEKQTAEWITNAALQSGAICNVFIDGTGYCLQSGLDRLISDFKDTPLEEYVRRSRKVADDLGAVLKKDGDRAENIWIRCESVAAREALGRTISAHCNVRIVVTSPRELEIGSPEADKGLALSHLADFLDINKAQVLAIGDNDNDLGMLDAAGVAVAMGNGTPNAKAAADYITKSNMQEGVAEVIEAVLRIPG